MTPLSAENEVIVTAKTQVFSAVRVFFSKIVQKAEICDTFWRVGACAKRAYSNLCGSKIARYSGGLSGGWSQSDLLIYLVFLKVFKNCWLLLVLWITIKGREEVLPFCKNKQDPNVLSNIIFYLLNGGKLAGKTSEDHLWGPLTQLQQQLSMFSSTLFEIVKFVLS